MQEDMKALEQRAKHNKESNAKTRVFGLIGYACLAVCIVFSIMGKWVMAGAFGIGLLAFSGLESYFDKQRVENDLEASLKIKDSNFKKLK